MGVSTASKFLFRLFDRFLQRLCRRLPRSAHPSHTGSAFSSANEMSYIAIKIPFISLTRIFCVLEKAIVLKLADGTEFHSKILADILSTEGRPVELYFRLDGTVQFIVKVVRSGTCFRNVGDKHESKNEEIQWLAVGNSRELHILVGKPVAS